MTLQQLVYVREIARSSSINKAAQNLYLSQSCISNALKCLEDELHIRIFCRNNRGVELTPEGKEFLGYANALLDQKKFIEDIYAKDAVSQPVIFSVAINHALFGVKAFLRFLEGLPERPYNLYIKETGFLEAIDNVYNHEVDLGLIIFNNFTEKIVSYVSENRDMEVQVIRETFPCPVVRAGHPLTHKKVVYSRDLAGYSYINYEHTHGQPNDVVTEVKLLGIERPEKLIRINDRATWSSIIANSDVIGMGNGLMKGDFIEPGLAIVPLADNPNVIRLACLRTRNQTMTPYMQEFIRILKEFADKL